MSRFGKLLCLTGPNAGTEYDLTASNTVLGRASDADIQVDDQFASRHHAEIRMSDNAYQIRDLNSKNGVTLDGRRLAQDEIEWLEDGCEIRLASTVFRFFDPSATVTAPSLIAVREPALRVDQATRQVFVDGRILDPPLSVKQFDLLWHLYQNRGRVVSKDEIAHAVWPEASGDVYDSSIDRMVSRVRSRIEPENHDEPRFITTVRGYGFRLLTG